MALCFADNEKARLVSNGSDNHLLLLDVRNFGLNGLSVSNGIEFLLTVIFT